MPGMSQWNPSRFGSSRMHRLAGSLLDSRISSGHWSHDIRPSRHCPHSDGARRLHPAQRHPGGEGFRKRAELCPSSRAAPLLLNDLHPDCEAHHYHLRDSRVHDWSLLQVSLIWRLCYPNPKFTESCCS